MGISSIGQQYTQAITQIFENKKINMDAIKKITIDGQEISKNKIPEKIAAMFDKWEKNQTFHIVITLKDNTEIAFKLKEQVKKGVIREQVYKHKPFNEKGSFLDGVAGLFGFKKSGTVQEAAEKAANEAMSKLAPSINKYSKELGVNPRIVAGVIYIELFRSITTSKGFIEGKLNSIGIGRALLAIKNATQGIGQMTSMVMRDIIDNFNDSKSAFYMGKGFEKYATEKDINRAKEGDQITLRGGIKDTKYKNIDPQVKFVAAMVAQLQTQWKNAGYDISSRPEILGTLYNIGFDNSKPKLNPKAGGSDNNFVFGHTMKFGDAVKAWAESSLTPEIGRGRYDGPS